MQDFGAGEPRKIDLLFSESRGAPLCQKMVLLPLSLLTAIKANCEVWPEVIFRNEGST